MNKIIPIQRSLASGPTLSPTSDQHPYYILLRYQILAPDSDIVGHWNRIFLITCIIALFIDPLYFFLPYVGGPACLQTDYGLGFLITFFRSVTDLFFVLHMVMKFRTAFVSPSSRVFGRGELVTDPKAIAMRYLKSDFMIDLAALLPLPQIVIYLIIPNTRKTRTDHANNTLALFVLIQYVPRIFVMFPLNRRIVKTTGVVAKTAWAGAGYNLILYMLASHVLGATWYLLSLGRQFQCWKFECEKENTSKYMPCLPNFLDCNSLGQPERNAWLNITRVTTNCNSKGKDPYFQFGMFSDAIVNEVFAAKFIDKYLYCLWWGLRSLSSYAQSLDTTTFVVETGFSIFVCIFGLILSAQLIGAMQGYLQSINARIEEWRLKRKDAEEWMRYRQLPEDLKERIRRYVQYRWIATRGVNEESILRSLPADLRCEIQRHLCLSLVRRVPFFAQMDDQLLDAICERLVLYLSTQGTYIACEGDPVNEMLFIIRGQLESSTTNGGKARFFNSIILRPGDFCGEELLTWALMPSSSLNVPSSTRTVKALTEVEAFALQAEDLKFVAGQFKRLHSMKLQHAFRYYSHQWRTWGACLIQVAWRKFKKRQLEKDLALKESLSYDPDEDNYHGDEKEGESYDYEQEEGNSGGGNEANVPQLAATIMASKFARGLHHKLQARPSSPSLDIPKLFKPDEPNFFEE